MFLICSQQLHTTSTWFGSVQCGLLNNEIAQFVLQKQLCHLTLQFYQGMHEKQSGLISMAAPPKSEQ
jgi:hypothetical protein